MSNRKVATELFISIKTVQFHLTHIYSKLGMNTRGELAAQFRDQDTSRANEVFINPGLGSGTGRFHGR